jgi:cyclopropane fatty-acyl-phospholipid synthase-like methyltransferase
MSKVSSPSCERNQAVILEILKQYITGDHERLLEIGSGTGQHAVYLGEQFPDLHWVTSDMARNHKVIKEWLKDYKLPNVHGPELLEVGRDDFPGKLSFDLVFTANTLHIMSWKIDKTFFKLLGKRLREGSLVFIYGPFNYDGEFSSDSNKIFDAHLKECNPKSGIRGFEDVQANMVKCGFKLLKDHEMPANNRLLVFERLLFSKD